MQHLEYHIPLFGVLNRLVYEYNKMQVNCDFLFLLGNVVAICMSHADASEELLRSWITNLQSENPQLANISIIFNLSQTPQ